MVENNLQNIFINKAVETVIQALEKPTKDRSEEI